MEKLRFKLRQVIEEKNEELDYSKFFGSPVFPKDFLDRFNLNEDLFICQINLEQIASYDVKYLPKEGMLYFFLEYTDSYNYNAKVIYSNEELVECCDMINEDFYEADNWYAAYIDFTDEEVMNFLIGKPSEIDDEITCMDNTGYIILLTIDPLETTKDFPNLGSLDGYYYFMIKESDLIKKDFSKVIFISTES